MMYFDSVGCFNLTNSADLDEMQYYAMRQFQCVTTTQLLLKKMNKEIINSILKFTLIKLHVHCLCLFKTSQAANQY